MPQAAIWRFARLRLLLGIGAERGHRDEQGRSARDWALAEGRAGVAALFES